MLNKIMLLAAAIVVAGLLTPSHVSAYGAAHVGYTHVGPAGVQHYGATEVNAPRGNVSTERVGAYGTGGAAYHAGAATTTTAGGVHAEGYHYAPSYSSAHYAYVR